MPTHRKRWIPWSNGDLTKAFRSRKASKRKTTFFILGACAIIGWVYIIFFSDLFIVNTIVVEGTQTLDPIDVHREVLSILDKRGEWRPWPKRHIFFIDTQQLRDQLNDRLFVSHITVDKVGRNVLRLKIEERVKNFVLHSRQQYAWVDYTGIVTQELTLDEKRHAQALLLGQRSSETSEPPIIKRNLDDVVSSGFQVFSGSEAEKWIELSDQLKTLNVSYREFEPPTVSSTIMRVLSQEGYELLMDITVPLDIQVATYRAFLKAKPKDIGQVEYLDVRVPGRVYLKEK